MYGAMLLFEDELIHVVSISFTSLILTELLMVGLTVRTWHPLMIVAQFLSLGFYTLSVIFMHYFGMCESGVRVGKEVFFSFSILILIPFSSLTFSFTRLGVHQVKRFLVEGPCHHPCLLSAALHPQVPET